MTDYKTSKILVSGAGGQLGRRIVELLVAAGASNVIAGTRDPAKLAVAGAEARKVDFADAESLPAAFAGVDQLLIISTDVTGEVRQKLQTAAVAAAKAAGVKHIVYTSLTNPGPESAVLLAPDHHVTEQAIEATGIPFTFLRNAVYMDMLLMSLPSALASGHWYTAAGQGRIARITREDCARAAAAALLAGPQGQRVVDVAGGELLTTEETAAIVSEVTGKPISVIHVDDAGLTAGMVGAGLPQPLAELLVSFEAATRLGQSDVRSQFVDLVGAPPASFRDFVSANRDMLVG
jgi:NAD(P)H dehydrogenase (quinone)